MILPHSAPFFAHWLEWCLRFYWGSLLICIVLAIAHKAYQGSQFQYPPPIFSGWYEVPLILLVAFSIWVVLCIIRQGYGLG